MFAVLLLVYYSIFIYDNKRQKTNRNSQVNSLNCALTRQYYICQKNTFQKHHNGEIYMRVKTIMLFLKYVRVAFSRKVREALRSNTNPLLTMV